MCSAWAGNLAGTFGGGSVLYFAVSVAFPGQERSRHMGELKRGNDRWDVFLETEPDTAAGTVRGRLHFVATQRRFTTGWVFLEWRVEDVHERFGEFSAVELWHFLEALEAEAT